MNKFSFDDPNILRLKIGAYWRNQKYEFTIEINKQRQVADLIDQFIQKLKAIGVTDYDASSKKMYHKGMILNDESFLSALDIQSGDEMTLTYID